MEYLRESPFLCFSFLDNRPINVSDYFKETPVRLRSANITMSSPRVAEDHELNQLNSQMFPAFTSPLFNTFEKKNSNEKSFTPKKGKKIARISNPGKMTPKVLIKLQSSAEKPKDNKTQITKQEICLKLQRKPRKSVTRKKTISAPKVEKLFDFPKQKKVLKIDQVSSMFKKNSRSNEELKTNPDYFCSKKKSKPIKKSKLALNHSSFNDYQKPKVTPTSKQRTSPTCQTQIAKKILIKPKQPVIILSGSESSKFPEQSCELAARDVSQLDNPDVDYLNLAENENPKSFHSKASSFDTVIIHSINTSEADNLFCKDHEVLSKNEDNFSATQTNEKKMLTPKVKTYLKKKKLAKRPQTKYVKNPFPITFG